MFSKDFLATSLSKEELTKRLKAVLEETRSSTLPDVCDVLISALNDGEEKIRKLALGVMFAKDSLAERSAVSV